MIFIIDLIITLSIFASTALGSAAFLNIAFTGEGSGSGVVKNSRAGGAVLARRIFAITIVISTFLFAVPILYLLGVYSESFARTSLSWCLSAAVIWSAAILPLLIFRLGIAKFLLSRFLFVSTSGATKKLRLAGFVSWLCSFGFVGAIWWMLVFSSASSTNLWNNNNDENNDNVAVVVGDGGAGAKKSTSSTSSSTTRGFDRIENKENEAESDARDKDSTNIGALLIAQNNKHTPFSCRFTANDVHVLRRSGILSGEDVADGTWGSKSSSVSFGTNNDNKNTVAAEVKGNGIQQQQQQQLDEGKIASESKSKNNIEINNKNDDPENKNNNNNKPKNPGRSNRQILEDLQRNACSGFRDSFLARIAVFGAVCVAALAGFAAVSTPIDNLFPYLNRNSVRDAQSSLIRLQKRLKNVVRRWGAVSQEGARLSWQLREINGSTSTSSSRLQHQFYQNNNNNNNNILPPPPPPLSPSINGKEIATGNNNNRGWFSKAKSFISTVVSFPGSNNNDPSQSAAAKSRQIIEKRLEEVTFEIAGYRYLANNLLEAIESTSMTLEIASMGKSTGGKLRAIFGICLSLFGAAKTINLLISVFWRKLSGEDAATAALRNIVTLFSLQGVFDVTEMASRIALILNLFLVVGSIRGFLILMFRLTQSKQSPSNGNNSTTMTTANNTKDGLQQQQQQQQEYSTRLDNNNQLSQQQQNASWISALLFGGYQVDLCPGTLSLVSFSLFMGLHFLGAFVLLRLGFPAKSRGIIIDAVGTVPFTPCHSVHDVSFLISVAVTAVMLKLMRNTLGDEKDDDDDDEDGCAGGGEFMTGSSEEV